MVFEQKGFTLIEIIIAIAILALLFSGSVIYYSSVKDNVRLLINTQNAVSVLETAQSNTITSKNASSYGIHLESGRYVLFKGLVYSAVDPNNVFYVLPASLEIANINLSGPAVDVLFNRVTGRTSNDGSFQIRVKNNTSKSKTIVIEQSGKADILSTELVPAGSRVSDSRHVHFIYSQDVTSATTLVLDFTSPTQTETISFQSYLNVPKTSFDWSGTISVGGEDQTLRINTHSLTSGQADFSISRDLRYNTKAVSIKLDGQELISYVADGTVTKGLSANAGIPQVQ